MIVILMGSPGAGKGTQAEMLTKELRGKKISTGDVLRHHIVQRTPLGLQAKSFMDAGQLVPDEVLYGIIKTEIASADKSRVVILDGFPRNARQAETLTELCGPHEIKGAIHLDVSPDEIVDRLSGRRICPQCGTVYHVRLNQPIQEGICDRCEGSVTLIQREDDKPEKVKIRLNVYEDQTRPVFNFYSKQGLYTRINGSGDPSDVYKELEALVKEMDQ